MDSGLCRGLGLLLLFSSVSGSALYCRPEGWGCSVERGWRGADRPGLHTQTTRGEPRLGDGELH